MAQKSLKLLSIDRYYDEMELSDEEKEARKELSRLLYTEVLTWLNLLAADIELNGTNLDKNFYENSIETRIFDCLDKQGIERDTYLDRYVPELAVELVKTTFNNIGDTFFTSDERALNIAQNEGNSIMNYVQERKAIKDGCKRKQWITLMDGKVRHTHALVNGVDIGIHDAFEVGYELMKFPRDRSMGASAREIIGCRCSVRYY